MGFFSRLSVASGKDRVKSILIVEDEPLIAFDNEHALEQAGYVVVATVDRFAAARGVMARRGIDLVFVDIRLHGEGGGLEVARHAGKLGIPVLFSTATCPPEARPLGLACLTKPHSARDLIRAVHAIDALVAGRPWSAPPNRLTLFDMRGE